MKPCPPSVSESVIQSFKDKGTPTPKDYPNLLAWSQPLTSSWNAQAIYILCSDFQEEIAKGEHPQIVDAVKNVPREQMVKWCISKLQRNRYSYIDQAPPRLGETVQEKSDRLQQKKLKSTIRNRRTSRRCGVCDTSITDD